MKPEDLMVGDWVLLWDDNPARVDCIGNVEVYLSEPRGQHELDWRVTYEHIKPIPITPEILEKNGFTYCKSDGGFYLHTTISYGNWDVNVVLFDITDEYRNNQLHISSPDDSYIAIHLMECNHVHELQHALRLCGIDKEIVL